MRDPSAPRVFLSYSRKDGLEFARRLQTMFEAEALSLYRDLSDLDGGEDWWRQVETAIKSVEHVVLVLTPGSLQSRYVRDEWKLARQEGKAVWPVSGPGELDLSHLPRWMARANCHDSNIPESFRHLVLGLKAPARQRRVPFMADPLPPGFVERSDKVAEIKRKLLNARGEPVAITAALRGAGGFGKTVLANALCYDPDIQDTFSDGILRVVLGEEPKDIVGRIADLINILTGEPAGVTHLEGAKSKLAEALDDRRCLLVIDDAWREQDLAPFLHRGPKDQTTRLVTTRDDRVLPSEAARVGVDAMTSSQAFQMLGRGLSGEISSSLRTRLVALAVRLGEWPLLLGLANGVLRQRMARGTSAEGSLTFIERALTQRGLAAAFRMQDRAARRSTALGALEVSLEQLCEAERMRFAELSVFVEDAEIPTSAALGLWHQTAELDSLDGEDLLTRLDELSLLIDLDLGRGVFRLHDVFRTLLRDGFANDRLADLDGKLMMHFRSGCRGGDLALLTNNYGLRHAIVHLRGAGDNEVADQLLLDPAWMQAKLDALGIQPLLADYVGQPKQTGLFAAGAALTLAANVLIRRPLELRPQLLARLMPQDAPGLEATLEKARSGISSPALVPRRASFTPPGAELRRFVGHLAEVRSVSVLAEGRRALSTSWDETLRLWDLETGAELRRFHGRAGRITSVTVLADGRRALSASSLGYLLLWDLEAGTEVHCFDCHKGLVNNMAILESLVISVAVLADGWRALSGCSDQVLRLFDLETGAELRRFVGHKDHVVSVEVLPDGRHALSGSRDKTLRLWNVETGEEVRCFEGHKGPITSVTVLANGRRAFSASTDLTLRLWDIETGKELRRFEGHQTEITSVSVLPDGRRMLLGSGDGTLRLWDLETGTEIRRLEVQDINSLAVLADGRRALCGAWDDKSLHLWDLETGTKLRRFEGHTDIVTCVTMLPDGQRALSGSGRSDKSLRLWDLEAEPTLRRYIGGENDVSSMAVLADGRRLLVGSRDRRLRLWDLETGSELRCFAGHEGEIISLAMTADGQSALSGSSDGTLRLWDLHTGAELRRFEGHWGAVTSVTVLPDGRRALSGSPDKTMRLWDLETGVELRCFEGHQGSVSSVTALADGRRALSGSADLLLRLWDLDSGSELCRFEGHEGQITHVVVLDDCSRVLSASLDKTLRLWDLETGARLLRIGGPEDGVTCVAVLANGRYALSGSRDRTLRLWDLETRVEMRRFEGHEESVNSLAVVAEGRRAISAGDDGTLRLWDLESGAELACLTFDTRLSALAWSEMNSTAIVRDERGRIHVIELVDRLPGGEPMLQSVLR